MNKQELITALMTKVKTPISHAEMERIVNGVLDTIKNEVAAGNSVQLVGFGTFESRNRAARTARNPQTGESLTIPAKKVPAFKAGKAFKEIMK